MKRSCVLVLLLLVAPAMALAQDAPQPNYPPGYDCASVPAGSQREACEAYVASQRNEGWMMLPDQEISGKMRM